MDFNKGWLNYTYPFYIYIYVPKTPKSRVSSLSLSLTHTHTHPPTHTHTHRDTQRHTETRRDMQRHRHNGTETQRHTFSFPKTPSKRRPPCSSSSGVSICTFVPVKQVNWAPPSRRHHYTPLRPSSSCPPCAFFKKNEMNKR